MDKYQASAFGWRQGAAYSDDRVPVPDKGFSDSGIVTGHSDTVTIDSGDCDQYVPVELSNDALSSTPMIVCVSKNPNLLASVKKRLFEEVAVGVGAPFCVECQRPQKFLRVST